MLNVAEFTTSKEADWQLQKPVQYTCRNVEDRDVTQVLKRQLAHDVRQQVNDQENRESSRQCHQELAITFRKNLVYDHLQIEGCCQQQNLADQCEE